MTNAINIRIADAVAAEINSAIAASAFQTLGFTAVRTQPDWDEDFKDLNSLACDVVYAPNEDQSVGLDSAGSIDLRPTINIVLRKRFVATDRVEATGRLKNASVDALVTLLDEIRKYFIGKRNTGALATEPDVLWSGDSQVKLWYDPKKLRESLFEGYVQLKFNASEAI